MNDLDISKETRVALRELELAQRVIGLEEFTRRIIGLYRLKGGSVWYWAKTLVPWVYEEVHGEDLD